MPKEQNPGEENRFINAKPADQSDPEPSPENHDPSNLSTSDNEELNLKTREIKAKFIDYINIKRHLVLKKFSGQEHSEDPKTLDLVANVPRCSLSMNNETIKSSSEDNNQSGGFIRCRSRNKSSGSKDNRSQYSKSKSQNQMRDSSNGSKPSSRFDSNRPCVDSMDFLKRTDSLSYYIKDLPSESIDQCIYEEHVDIEQGTSKIEIKHLDVKKSDENQIIISGILKNPSKIQQNGLFLPNHNEESQKGLGVRNIDCNHSSMLINSNIEINPLMPKTTSFPKESYKENISSMNISNNSRILGNSVIEEGLKNIVGQNMIYESANESDQEIYRKHSSLLKNCESLVNNEPN